MLRANTSPYPFSNLKYDITAGIVVFLVAIPLCLGIALASGAPLFSGLLAGIIGGIIVGSISESAVSVSGPAAGMVAVVLTAITQLGGFDAFLLALFFAGVLQIIIGSIRAGFIADYVPSNVIQGLLCAIGILIILKQLPFAFTYTAYNDEFLSLLKSTGQEVNIDLLMEITEHLNFGATLITVLSLALLIFLDKTKNVRLKAIPGPVAVVILGVIINEVSERFFVELAQYSTELVNIPIHENLASFLTQFKLPAFDRWMDPKIYLYAFILAAVASLEALLNLEAIEKLDRQRRYCSRNRELVAQGLGNLISGLLGGLPITSVVVRGSVNIQAGSKSKLSTIIHGALILFVTIFIPKWINMIPLASLASILIFVGFKLTKPAIYRVMYAQGLPRFIPFVVTIVAIIMTNLLTGILIGLAVSFFYILKSNSQIKLDIIKEKHPRGIIKRIIMPQHMSFLRKASLVAELDGIPEGTNLIIDARDTQYMDQDIMEVLDVFIKNQAPDKRIALNMLGFKDHYEIHDKIEFLNVTTYDTQSSLKPNEVLEILKEGNKRFMTDKPIHRSISHEIKATASAQHPIAIVLGCIDSRVPIETIFDMGVGDVFVARIAGNVVNDDILASIEFACHISGAKLIVVLGHTYCGAIKAACEDGVGGYLGDLLHKIRPAVLAETETVTDRTDQNTAFVTNVTRLNVENSIQHIFSKSVILNKLVRDNQVGLVGAMYDVSSGIVSFTE